MMNKENSVEKRSYLFLFIGYAIFGFSFMFSKNTLSIASPFLMLGFRFTIAFLIMQVLFIWKKKKLKLKGKKVGVLFLLGLVQPVTYFIGESYGVRLLQTSYVGIIISLIPLVSFYFGFLFLKETVKLKHILLGIISIVGVTVTTLGEQVASFSLLGFFFILISVISAAFFNVFSRKIAPLYDTYERTYLMFLIGMIVFIPLGLFQNGADLARALKTVFASPRFFIDMIYLAGISSVLAFLMINDAMTHVKVSKAAIFANLTTVVSILAGVLFLQESFGWFQLLGSLLIIVSVYLMNKDKNVQRVEEGK